MPDLPPELVALLARLTPQQQETFLAIVANARDEESLNRELQGHPDFLKVMQPIVPSAIREDSSADLDAILQELDRPVRNLQEMPQRIELVRRALATVKREENAALWAALHNEMANSLAQSPRGDRAENLEAAIAYSKQALAVYTREADPANWAMTQHTLANVYVDRIRGDRAANLEAAIAHSKQALTVYTREADPANWAMTQHTLAAAYRARIRGDRTANLEEAIAYSKQALQVRTCETDPAKWAMTQHTLANAYVDRILDDRAANLEEAIAHYEQALQVRTREADPANWAMTQNSLANAYVARIRGERAANLEEAIAHSKQALTVYTREGFPVGWAMTRHTLANAYRVRIRGDRAANLEEAIAHYEQALQIRTREADPANWAMTQNSLANAYVARIRGDRAANLEAAIAHSKQALTVYTREADPANWAMIQHNLAIAYRARIRGDRVANLEEAIAHYEQALQIRTREADPANWAMTQNNLANAYRARIRGDRAANLGVAIAHYEQALAVYTLQQFPTSFQQTQRNLGHLHFSETAWAAALTAYQEAIRAEQVLLGSAYTEAGRQAEVAQTADLYALSAYALLKLGRAGEALRQLEQGKTRLLARALALNAVDVSLLPGSEQELLRQLRQTLRELETEMRLPADTPARRDERVRTEALHQARTKLNEAIERIREIHPDFMPEGLGLPEILSLIPPGAALVAPLVTSQGSAVFVVPAGLQSVSLEEVLWIDSFKEADLQALLRGRAELGQLGSWLGAYVNAQDDRSTWFDVIEATGQALWRQLMAPIAECLAPLQVRQVLLMPQGGLGLLPLHAAWHEVDGTRRYFLDNYTTINLPSSYAHKVSLKRMTDPKRQGRSLLAVINPTEDLPFTPAEGEQVASLFEKGQTTVLPGVKATGETVMKQAMTGYVHFSCHGFYRWDDPMQSGLVLANHESLTLAQIIGQLNLDKTRLVTLSACETGITDIRRSPDEYLGLPTGFLQAGAPAVVSTLWAVNDLSTMLLMERFYRLHLQEEMNLPDALRQAQIWLRDVTAGELAERFAGEEEAVLSSTRMSIQTASAYFTRFTKLDPKQRPFAHPYYWAAFTFTGA